MNQKNLGLLVILFFLTVACSGQNTAYLSDPQTEFEDVFEDGLTYTIDSQGNLVPVNETWNDGNTSSFPGNQATQPSQDNELQFFSPDELAHLPVTPAKIDGDCGAETQGDVQLLLQNSSSSNARFLTARTFVRPSFSTRFLDGGTATLKNLNLNSDSVDVSAERCEVETDSDDEKTYTWKKINSSDLRDYSLVVMQTQYSLKKTWFLSEDFLLIEANKFGTFSIEADALLDSLSSKPTSAQNTKTHFVLKRSL